MTSRRPISEKITGLRQRIRADGSWRIWWEPNASARALGFEPVELDANRATWSTRQARAMSDDVDRKRRGDTSHPVAAGGRTISALLHAYQRDPDFKEKKPKTQASYRANMVLIDAKWGSFPVISFTKPILREWYLTNRKARGDTQAVRLNGMFSILFAFAELKGWRPEGSNPCTRLKVSIPKGRSRVATWHELDAVLDAAATTGLPSIGTAVLLSALQGQRQTDIMQATTGLFQQVTMTTGQSQKTVWSWRVDRSKRGTLGLMRLHPIVLDRVVPLLDLDNPDAPLLVEERLSRAYDEHLFQKRWIEVRKAAAEHAPTLTGCDQLQFRDLRRTFAVWAKAGGAADDDVGDVLGNSAALDPRLQETYMPASFATASRAVLSIRRPNTEERKKA